MNKEEILNHLENWINSDDILAITKEANESIKLFRQIVDQEEAELKEKEADLDADIEYDTAQQELNLKIEEAISNFKAKVKAEKKKIKEQELHNLEEKKKIIEEFKNLVQNEENIGRLFNEIKAIREKWNEVGNIPRDAYQDIQSDFARLNEEFNYNVNIYKELQEHDLKKNYSLKNQLIHEVKDLLNEEKIKVIENKLKTIQNEWTSIGPTFNEHWEELKKTYWDTVHELYDKIKVHYEGLKEKQAENLNIKNQLIEDAQKILDTIKDFDSNAQWEKATNKIKEIQEQWKSTGRVMKEKNDKIWQSFREILDEFYDSKSSFYQQQNEVYKEKANKKEDLIKKAAEIAESEDWKNATNQLKKLQNEWTKVGHAGKFQEQKLWKQFRKYFDDFFAKKDAYFVALDKANEENLTKKEVLIKKIEEYKPKATKEETLSDLQEFSKEYNAIGNVPFKKKDAIYKAFKKAIDKHYSDLDISNREIAKMQIEAKIEQMKEAGEDISEILKEERIKIRKRISDLNAEIAKIENNFGFFNISKGAEKLMENFKNEINKKKDQIETLKKELQHYKD